MRSKKAVIGAIIAVAAIAILGYTQYASASKIAVTITDSELLEENNNQSLYNIRLEFNNPSLLFLSAGHTEFYISAYDERFGQGVLEPFTLPPMSTTLVGGKFHTDKYLEPEESTGVKITGTTKYDLGFTSIEVPFVYYPTEEQASNFIRQK